MALERMAGWNSNDFVRGRLQASLYYAREKRRLRHSQMLPPLGPMDMASDPVAIYSVQRVNPSYMGPAFILLDSNSAQRTVNFGADGWPDLTNAPSWGNGTSFTVHTWYDQSGFGRHLTSPNNVRPAFRLNMWTLPGGKVLPWIDYTTKNQHLASVATFLNVGAGHNLTLMMTYGVFGWSSADTHARSPGVPGVNGPLVSFGTLTNNTLVHSAYSDLGETAFNFQVGDLFIEAAQGNQILDLSRVRTGWFNVIAGEGVSGGLDERLLWEDRETSLAEALAQRIVVGSTGTLNQSHNGPIMEIIVYNDDANPIAAIEAHRLAQHRQLTFSTPAGFYPDRYLLLLSGQSLAQYLDTADSAASGLLADRVTARVMQPYIRARQNFEGAPSKTLTITGNTTAYGGTSLLKGDAQVDGYWVDQNTWTAGTEFTTWLANYKTILLRRALRRKVAIMWSQGEADALVLPAEGPGSGTYTYENYKAAMIWLFNAMRADIGGDIPIIIGPLGKQTGQATEMWRLRKIQEEVAQELPNVYICGDSCYLDRQDSVHLQKSPPDNDGFAARGIQISLLFSWLYGDSAAKWDSPIITGATQTGPSQVDVHIAWPPNAGGNDISPSTGIGGFFLTDNGVAATVSSAARLDSNTIRLTTAAPLTGPVLLDFNPYPDPVLRSTVPRDNNPLLNMQLRPAWDIAVV